MFGCDKTRENEWFKKGAEELKETVEAYRAVARSTADELAVLRQENVKLRDQNRFIAKRLLHIRHANQGLAKAHDTLKNEKKDAIDRDIASEIAKEQLRDHECFLERDNEELHQR